jgi:tRNA(Ile)-lysidine synthase
VRQFSDQERLFRRTQRILCAVSGGPDSIALLLIMLRLREHYGFEVLTAHFDHQLRPDSRGDLEFVRDLCRDLGVECVTGEGDVRARATEARSGIEATARDMRYGFLNFVAGNVHADRIATGHTRDDQVETVLHRILRGTGVRGLRGIAPRAPSPGAGAVDVIRPLLRLTRADVLDVCAEAGITPRLDASNASADYTRNRLRHELLPAIATIEPGAPRKLLELAESAREAFVYIERDAAAAQPLERRGEGALFAIDALRRLPGEALLLVVEREASFFKLPVTSNRTRIRNLRDVLGRGRGSVRFGEVVVEVSSGHVRIGPVLSPAEPVPSTILSVPGVTSAGRWLIEVSTRELPAEPGDRMAVLDRSAVSGVLRVRSMEPGDRIAFGGGVRRVRHALAAAGVPAWARDEALVLSVGDTVVAVPGAPPGVNPAPASDEVLYVRVRLRPDRRPPTASLLT